MCLRCFLDFLQYSQSSRLLFWWPHGLFPFTLPTTVSLNCSGSSGLKDSSFGLCLLPMFCFYKICILSSRSDEISSFLVTSPSPMCCTCPVVCNFRSLCAGQNSPKCITVQWDKVFSVVAPAYQINAFYTIEGLIKGPIGRETWHKHLT